MKCYVNLISLWVAIMLPLSLFAVQPATNSFVDNQAGVIYLPPVPDRDDADEDSIAYSYGFENDWSDWTTVDNTAVGEKWHISEEHAYQDGSSWWCGDELLNGYDNHWLQYLKTPVLDLRNHRNLRLEFKLYYNCEDPDHEDLDPPDPNDWPDYDGWDGCNVWISTDGGDDWEVLTPIAPDYDFESLFSFGYEWGMGPNIPGWAGFETEWFDAEFDLRNYAEEEVVIRWAFCSDPGWATGDAPDNDREALGMLIDEMQITADDGVLWSNDGTEVGEIEIEAIGEEAGDHWEITNEDAHTGEFSAHCPIEMGLNNSLITAPLDIPGEGYYTFFDFWIIANTVEYDSDGDNNLDDLFRVQVSANDRISWTDIIYDYGRPDRAPHNEWYDDWGYYGPYKWFQTGAEEWKQQLNLTQWAGQTVHLRFLAITDSIMDEENPGTGFWIDDFRLLTNQRRENDMAINWVRMAYPTTMGQPVDGDIEIRNNGMLTQNNLRKYYRIDNARRPGPIMPWQGEVLPDSTERNHFGIPELPYSGASTVLTWLELGNDEDRTNDSAKANLVVYPENMYELGYDFRRWDNPWGFVEDNGPAVLFTPVDDDIVESFDLMAVRVRWSGDDAPDQDITTTMRIFDDTRGAYDDELYSAQVTITPDDLDPNIHHIDLSGVDELKNLEDDFWIYFNIEETIITEEDTVTWPRVLGRRTTGNDPWWGENHYYISDGDIVRDGDDYQEGWNFEYQIQTIITTAGEIPEGKELDIGREEVVDTVWARDLPMVYRLALIGGGLDPVTVSGIEIDNDAFTLSGGQEFPFTLLIGQHVEFALIIDLQEEGDYSAHITFHCDDETPPELTIGGSYSVEPEAVISPVEFSLGNAYPNPFNSTAVIPFTLTSRAHVALKIFDLSGRQVRQLVSGNMSAGKYNVPFNGEDLAAGIYIYRLETENYTATKKLVLVK